MRLSIIAGPRVETAAYRSLDLQSALILCSPSLVLEEAPADGPGFGAGSPEGKAIAAYAQSRRGALERIPVDMAGRDEAMRRIGYLEPEKAFFEEARELADRGKLGGAEMGLLAAWELSRNAYDQLFSSSLRQANSRALCERLEQAEDMKYALALRLCRSSPRLADREPYFTACAELLARKRKELAARTLAALDARRPKSAVLICGAAEKRRLERSLEPHLASLGGFLREFWEIDGPP